MYEVKELIKVVTVATSEFLNSSKKELLDMIVEFDVELVELESKIEFVSESSPRNAAVNLRINSSLGRTITGAGI